jgi:hypothetical protein
MKQLNITDKLELFKEKKIKEQTQFRLAIEKNIREHEDYLKKNKSFFKNFYPSKIKYYEKWLKGYMEKNESPTHYYDYNFGRAGFVIAKSDFELIALYGAKSLNIIIPQDIKCIWSSESLGHNNLYFMKDFIHIGNWIPVYEDLYL